MLALSLANLRAQDDDETARALNDLTDEERSADEWLAYMEDRRATRQVATASCTETTARRSSWADGSREWWRHDEPVEPPDMEQVALEPVPELASLAPAML